MKKIVDITEVLCKIIAAAEEIVGRMTTAITESLEQTIIRDRQEVDLSGGCGKLRLGVQYREDRPVARLALSAEAIVAGCEPLAERWATKAYAAIAELEPRAQMVAVQVDENGVAIRQLWIVDHTGVHRGV